MKAVLTFFVFLIILVSASAVIDVQINGRNIPSSPTNVHPYQGKTIFTVSEGVLQGFTSPYSMQETVKGAITFRQKSKAPPVGEWYMFNIQQPASVQEEPPTTPTGGTIIYTTEKNMGGVIIALIILISIISLFLILKGQSAIQTKVLFVAATLIIVTFASMKYSQPTGYAVQEIIPETMPEQTFQPSAPQQHVVNAFTLTWTNGGPVTFLPAGAPPGQNECSDGINNDFEDNLIDCADPGCHSDGNANNPGSCVPTDKLEMDMLEYDHPPVPVIDNQIDVYDIVGWIQYYDIHSLGGVDYSSVPLVHCIDATCSNQKGPPPTANCVGNVDPNKDSLVTVPDAIYLQSVEINNDDSRTMPTPANPICKNPS